MTDEVLTVVAVNYMTSRFMEVSLHALAGLTKNKYKVIICDNGSSWSDRKSLRRVVGRYGNVDLLFRKQSAPGSIGHGEALNILIDRIDTPYGAILDADATFLKSGWDEILINQLDDKVKIIGSSRGKHFLMRPTDLLSSQIHVVLFDIKIFKSLKVDMRPTNPQIGQDVGWEIGKFLESGYKGKVLEIRSTREYKQGPFRNVICDEYYLKGYDDIFACHFGRGAGLGGPKYKDWSKLLQLPYINKIARKIKGYRERREWLAICREIIEKQ